MDRDGLCAALREVVDVPWIEAAWIGGSEAFGRHDRWSDVDLQVLCDPARADEVFARVERCLEELGGIDAVWHPPPSPDYAQRFYQVRGVPEWCMVDLAVMRPERLGPYLDPERHGRPVVWFDRTGVLRPVRDDAVEDVLRKRLEALRPRVRMLAHLPAKALERGRLVEAVDAYQKHLLGPLVEVLRARHCPHRQDFGLRYLEVDLPAEVVERLERLAMPGSREALRGCIDEARSWLEAELRQR